MKGLKQMVQRGLLGLLMGLFLNMSMLIVASLKSDMITLQSSALQTYAITYALLGFYFSAISIIFDMTKLSIAKKFMTHMILALPIFPVAHLVGFLPSQLSGRLLFVGMYLSGYVISFIIYKLYSKKQLKTV